MGRSSAQKRGHSPAPSIFGPCLLWPNGWMDQYATWYGGRPRPTRHCIRWRPSPLKGAQLPQVLLSTHVYCGHGRPSQLLLSSCYLLSNSALWWRHLYRRRNKIQHVHNYEPSPIQASKSFLGLMTTPLAEILLLRSITGKQNKKASIR